MKTNRSLLMGIYLIIFICYSVLIMMFLEAKTASFWIVYVFTALTFLIILIAIAVQKGQSGNQSFLQISSFVLSNVCLLVQLVVGTLLVIITSSIKITVVVEIVLASVFAVLIILAVVGRRTVEDLDGKTKEKVSYIREIEKIMDSCGDSCQNKNLKKYLLSLKEKVHFSDPISSSALLPVEERLLEMAKQIQNSISEIEVAEQKCAEFNALLLERNRECKNLK